MLWLADGVYFNNSLFLGHSFGSGSSPAPQAPGAASRTFGSIGAGGGGGFGALATGGGGGGGGFGGLAQQQQSPTPPAASSAGSMWAPRK